MNKPNKPNFLSEKDLPRSGEVGTIRKQKGIFGESTLLVKISLAIFIFLGFAFYIRSKFEFTETIEYRKQSIQAKDMKQEDLDKENELCKTVQSSARVYSPEICSIMAQRNSEGWVVDRTETKNMEDGSVRVDIYFVNSQVIREIYIKNGETSFSKDNNQQ